MASSSHRQILIHLRENVMNNQPGVCQSKKFEDVKYKKYSQEALSLGSLRPGTH